jgi:hypothetical protein
MYGAEKISDGLMFLYVMCGLIGVVGTVFFFVASYAIIKIRGAIEDIRDILYSDLTPRQIERLNLIRKYASGEEKSPVKGYDGWEEIAQERESSVKNDT